jgi:hypothetical protein
MADGSWLMAMVNGYGRWLNLPISHQPSAISHF